MKWSCWLLLVMGFSAAAHAGDWYEKGNGGFTINCPGKSPQVFDLYELENRFRVGVETPKKLTLDQNKSGSLKERFQYLLEKIARLNPHRAVLYADWYKTFADESEFLPHAHLSPVEDLGLAEPGAGCSLLQTVFQRTPGLLNRRYTVDEGIWNSLSPLNQAALLLHEFAYREFASAPSFHETSEQTRYFNALVNSSEFAEMTPKDYLQTLQMIHVARADYQGNSVLLSYKNITEEHTWTLLPLQFQSSGIPETIIFEAGDQIHQGEMIFDSVCRDVDGLQAFGVVSYGITGKILYIGELKGFSGVSSCLIEMRSPKRFLVRGNSWGFDSDGHLMFAEGSFNQLTDRNASNPLIYEYYIFTALLSENPVAMDMAFGPDLVIKSVEFDSSACYTYFNPGYRQIRLSRTGAMSSAGVTFHPDQIDKEVQSLPACE